MSEAPATVGAPPSARSFWNHKVAFAAQKQWLWRWLNTLERHSGWPDVRQTLLRSHMFSSSPPMSHKHNICEIEQMNKMQRCDEASNLFKAHSEALRSSVLDAAHAFPIPISGPVQSLTTPHFLIVLTSRAKTRRFQTTSVERCCRYKQLCHLHRSLQTIVHTRSRANIL